MEDCEYEQVTTTGEKIWPTKCIIDITSYLKVQIWNSSLGMTCIFESNG